MTQMVAQLVKNPPAMQETWVRSLGWSDTLEEGMATHSSILVWRIPVDRGTWQATVMGSQTVRHDWATKHMQAQNRKRLTDRENRLVVVKEWGVRVVIWDQQMQLLYTEWIKNKVLFYSTRNYMFFSIVRKNICIYRYNWIILLYVRN